MSEDTVKFHLTNVCRKVGVNNRAAAVRYALEHGLRRNNHGLSSSRARARQVPRTRRRVWP
jgi:hypothetical protein